MTQYYNIVRFVEDGRKSRTILKDLTLEQAREHCNNPETSSKTASNNQKKNQYGCEWFEGFVKQ